ncbi:MAG TPA: UPF0182 family protein [Bacillota bacterium]
MKRLRNYLLGLILLIGIALLIFFNQYLDLIWFRSMGAARVFWISLITGPLFKLLLTLLLAAFFLVNLFLAGKAFYRPRAVPLYESGPQWSRESLLLPGILITLAVTFLLTAGLSMDWQMIQQFLHPVTTGVTDPIFHKDTGFYLFTYPLLHSLYNLAQAAVFLALVGSTAVYVLAKAIQCFQTSWEVWFPAKLHLVVLGTAFGAVKLWGYHLSRYSLLFKESARLTGINYTAAHANLLILTILSWVVVAVIAALWVTLFRKKYTLLLTAAGAWLLLALGLNIIYPGIIQSLVVKPNEYELEAPYLAYHILFTRQAYDLDRVKVKNFQPREQQIGKISPTHPVVTDLRLWDYRPLLASYNQLQAIRPYYRFTDIDIDRYPTASGGQRQIMLAARELIAAGLSKEAQASWINLHLTYTHGYGAAANQVNQYSDQGQPVFISRDLPPRTDPEFAALATNRPEIYFGEQTNHYIIVNTRTPEFDYPRGDSNTTTVYLGNTGIPLNSFFIKALMALKYHEANFILSSQITSASRVLLYRNIRERVQKLAPFLKFDQDPYLVVAQGQLYWIIDAYTVSSFYPYAQYHTSGINYIRNSVKAVVNAYDGSVNFYITDSGDPIIRVWQKIFPALFKPVDQLNAELISHLRYPEDLMTIQSNILARYHMTNPKTFYAQEDHWEIPVYNNGEPFEPYYVTLVLPGENKSEFVMMQPFSPRNKQNLSSWLIARCDRPHYGELLLYTLPKDQNIYGPAQIDSRINQDQTISQLITLWNQNQSRALWGNLLILPVENSLLYVKPLFIESEQTQQAELKKVVMVYQNQVVIGDTVTEALNRINPDQTQAVKSLPEALKKAEPDRQTKALDRKEAIRHRLEQISKELQQLSKELDRLGLD